MHGALITRFLFFLFSSLPPPTSPHSPHSPHSTHSPPCSLSLSLSACVRVCVCLFLSLPPSLLGSVSLCLCWSFSRGFSPFSLFISCLTPCASFQYALVPWMQHVAVVIIAIPRRGFFVFRPVPWNLPNGQQAKSIRLSSSGLTVSASGHIVCNSRIVIPFTQMPGTIPSLCCSRF